MAQLTDYARKTDILVNNVGIFELKELSPDRRRRLATPEEVANLVVYMASPLSSATNGAPMRVDGGVVRAMP